MDFSDISARFKKMRDDKAPPAPGERNYAEIHALRARILGVLIRDARQAHGSTLDDLARELGTEVHTVEAWELGHQSPSLPQLEMLAYSLGVPVSHFWNTRTLAAEAAQHETPTQTEEYSALRDRVIGIRLQTARQDAQLSREELAQASGLSPDQVETYELGQQPVPFPELTSLAAGVRQPMAYFLEGTGQVGRWLALQEQYERFSELPDEMRAFVSQLVNQPFIEIAMRLSKLPIQDLRAVGEKILDITL
jgi:transcriptional regulator with XRE-family HTH domain